jgi:hypothetical protein
MLLQPSNEDPIRTHFTENKGTTVDPILFKDGLYKI